MKFTCLSKGRGYHFPPCHILNFCGFRILIDCPLDLSALTVFAPIHYGSSASHDDEQSDDSLDKYMEIESEDAEKPLVLNSLIHAEPWYKTVENLHLWNVSFIDVVLISSPMGMLGLPYLTRTKGFSAKIYMTEVAAKLGKLTMEDLLSMHTEYRQFYGSEECSFPSWMEWDCLQSLPSALREIVLGIDGISLGGWMALYSAADIEDCVRKVHTLKFAEEACYNGTIIVKPCSSGSELGACNWVLKCPDGSIGYISNSIFASHHALGFDYHSLQSKDLIIYADFSFLDALKHADDSNNSIDPSSNFSDLEEFLLHPDETTEEKQKLDFICSCIVDSIKAGGSVIIPVEQLGLIMQLLEQVSALLESLAPEVPICIISSVAEELLAFTNIIPEWVCRERQEKLFSGEPLFVHFNLIKSGKLQVYPTIHSPKLLKNWQEPCVVFCPHWSLRLGPSVQLLRRWYGDPNSLLILEEGIDVDMALLPFNHMEMKMKILRCSFLTGITLQKIQPLLKILQPQSVVLSEDLSLCVGMSDEEPFSITRYPVNETVRLPRLRDGRIIEMAAELSLKLQCRNLEEESLSIARLKGNLVMDYGKRHIVTGDELPLSKHSSVLHWGSPDLQKLLCQLSEMGVSGSLKEKVENDDFQNASIVHINSPGEALVEIQQTSTRIIAENEKLAATIFQAVSSVMDGI